MTEKGSRNYSGENLDIALDKIENEHDRLDQDIQRVVDRGERFLKIYLIVTSILATSFSIGAIEIPEPIWWRVPASLGVLAINGIYIKHNFDLMSPKLFEKLDYDLDNEKSLLPKSKLEEDEDMVKGYLIQGINKVNQENQNELKKISNEFNSTFEWFFLALVTNISVVVTLSVI
jgi:hypothetical protein